MTRSSFTRFATALAIGATILTAGGAANARGGFGGGGYPMVGSFHGTPSFAAAPSYTGTVVRDHRGRDYYPGNAQGGRVVTPTNGYPRYCFSNVAHSGPCNMGGGPRDHRTPLR